MLNWIMYWTGQWLLGSDGPLNANIATSTSADVTDAGKLPTFWGLGVLQGAHVGIFIGIAALVVYALVLNRTTLGLRGPRGRAQPRCGSLRRDQRGAELLPGHGDRRGLRRHRGLDGRARLGVPRGIEHDLASRSGFSGSQSHCSAGTPRSARARRSPVRRLLTGTSQRNLDPSIFKPELASNLTLLIQGLVVLFVGADLLILYAWNARKKLRRREAPPPTPMPEPAS